MSKKDRPKVMDDNFKTVPDYDHYGWPSDYDGYIWPVKLWYIFHNWLPLRWYKVSRFIHVSLLVTGGAVLFILYVTGSLTGGEGSGW